jgi:transcriptional regulator with XRE-family HTH domain
MSHLGTYFRDQRTSQGLTLGQVARMVSYSNVSKGSNKIVHFEREGDITEELLARLAEALHIDLPAVDRLIEQDRQEYLRAWEAWVSQPAPMELVVKIIPAVYATMPLPETVTTPEQGEAFACEYAKEHRRQVCLAVSRRLSVWIDKEGQVYARTEARPDSPNTPFMRLRSSSRRFLLGFGDSGTVHEGPR